MIQRFFRKQEQPVLEQCLYPVWMFFILALGHLQSSSLLTLSCLCIANKSPTDIHLGYCNEITLYMLLEYFCHYDMFLYQLTQIYHFLNFIVV